MERSDLDFLASCISWIEDDDKRNAALMLCDGRFQNSDAYDPEEFRELLTSKKKLNDEFDLVLSSPGVQEMYCSACREFYDIPMYVCGGEEIDTDCPECDGELVPITSQVEARERIEQAKDFVGSFDTMPGAYDRAFIGISEIDEEYVAIYDGDKCVSIHADNHDMSFEDAAEHLQDQMSEADYGADVLLVFGEKSVPLLF